MGTSKTELFTDRQASLAVMMKALGHPARIAIIEHLIKTDHCICGDIVDVMPLSQATVSQHLKELKNAGLIKGNVEGKAICYCLDEDAIEKVHQYFSRMLTKLDKKKCC